MPHLGRKAQDHLAHETNSSRTAPPLLDHHGFVPNEAPLSDTNRKVQQARLEHFGKGAGMSMQKANSSIHSLKSPKALAGVPQSAYELKPQRQSNPVSKKTSKARLSGAHSSHNSKNASKKNSNSILHKSSHAYNQMSGVSMSNQRATGPNQDHIVKRKSSFTPSTIQTGKPGTQLSMQLHRQSSHTEHNAQQASTRSQKQISTHPVGAKKKYNYDSSQLFSATRQSQHYTSIQQSDKVIKNPASQSQQAVVQEHIFQQLQQVFSKGKQPANMRHSKAAGPSLTGGAGAQWTNLTGGTAQPYSLSLQNSMSKTKQPHAKQTHKVKPKMQRGQRTAQASLIHSTNDDYLQAGAPGSAATKARNQSFTEAYG